MEHIHATTTQTAAAVLRELIAPFFVSRSGVPTPDEIRETADIDSLPDTLRHNLPAVARFLEEHGPAS